MSYPEKFLTEGEQVVTQFRPHWRLLVIPVLWVIAAIAAIILAYQVIPGEGAIDLVITLAVIVALVPLAVVPFVKYWFTAYVLTNERLITRSGVIARSGIEIPLDNITNVVFNQSILERLLKSGDLLIESAGESGQSRFSDIPEPEAFQSLLYKVREDREDAHRARAAMPTPGGDATERLERLARLHADGVISDEEYEEKRRELLDEI
ncbi:MAG: PH domain-containing protein [Acidimicrobiia bacterium]|nr:PH domain-containing protein [Acidimicrobiia bacterium]